MLDIRFIRENADVVEQKAKQKGYSVDVKVLLGLDEKRRKLLSEIEAVRSERNKVSTFTAGEQPSPAKIEEGKRLKQKIEELEKQFSPTEEEFIQLLKSVPNMPADDVPVGTSEAENVVAREWGEKPHFDFEPKSHWQIAEARGLIDKERAAKVAGSRFAYIKGDLVKLQFALIQFVIDVLTNEEKLKKIIEENELKNVSPKPFIPVLPPFLIRTDIFEAMDRLEPREDRYKIENEDLWLQGSAEHTLGPMHMGELLALEDLPVRYLGYATSFRREAGNYGKDTEGIIRMHQFDKLEMESFVNPHGGMTEHLFMIAVQEYLMQQLGIPYHVLLKCTADIGKPNARGVDLEAWLPGQNKFLETHTADFMTDYQTRRLGIKVKHISPSAPAPEHDTHNPLTDFAHTNDATALALGRTMVAIIENFQQADGSVEIPKVLQPYMQNQTTI